MDIIIHVAHSKSRKNVGTFILPRLRKDKDEYEPLPRLEVFSKITKNLAKGIKGKFKMLQCASGFTVICQ